MGEKEKFLRSQWSSLFSIRGHCKCNFSEFLPMKKEYTRNTQGTHTEEEGGLPKAMSFPARPERGGAEHPMRVQRRRRAPVMAGPSARALPPAISTMSLIPDRPRRWCCVSPSTSSEEGFGCGRRVSRSWLRTTGMRAMTWSAWRMTSYECMSKRDLLYK